MSTEHRRAYIRERYAKNIERERKYQREWKRKWRRENPEKSKLADKRRPPAELERRRLRASEYAKKHRAERAVRNIARERAKSKCPLTRSERESILEIYKRAQLLRQVGMKVQVDHKIPLSRGGLHHPDNLQIIPEFENGTKHCDSSYVPIFVL